MPNNNLVVYQLILLGNVWAAELVELERVDGDHDVQGVGDDGNPGRALRQDPPAQCQDGKVINNLVA